MISLDSVGKSFDGGRTFAVRDVTLHVARGELVVLLGSSGCGKSTTLRLINRLLPLTRGRIAVDGREIQNCHPAELRRSIGYVIQSIGLFPHMTVAENIAVVPTLLRWPKERILRRVDELLELVRLPPPEYAHRYPSSLSGGQQQRVGVARALAVEPHVMLMDEPFGALDPVTRDSIQREFRQIQKSLNLSVLLVTHDMTEAVLLADRIAVMHGGTIRQVGAPGELLRRPADDYVARLMEAPRRQAEAVHAICSGEALSGNHAS